MRPTGNLPITIKPIAITTVTVIITLILAAAVMPLPFAKDSRLFLYSFVFKNHLLSLSELFPKKNAASIRNGNDGRSGITAPSAPRARPMQPSAM